MEYKDIELTSQQLSLLKQMKISDIPETEETKTDLFILKKFKLIKCINSNDAFYRSDIRVYEITPLGLMWLQFHRKDIVRTWYPHIISTLALIVSIIAIIISIYSCSVVQEAPSQVSPQIRTNSNAQSGIVP